MGRTCSGTICVPLALVALAGCASSTPQSTASHDRPDEGQIYRPGMSHTSGSGLASADILPDEGMIYRPGGRVAVAPPPPPAARPAPAENRVMATTEERSRPAPAPAKPAATAESASRSSRLAGSMAVPTGQRETSSLLLETYLPGEVIAGQQFGYDLKVTNLTDITLDNVEVTDSIPGSLRIVSSDPSPRSGANGLTVWDLGSLAPRESKTIHMSATAADQGRISSCASVSYNSGLCSTVNVVKPAIRLAVQAPEHARMCDQIPVKLIVTNTGSGSARNVHVHHPLPAGVTLANGGNTLDFDAGTLGPGESRQFDAVLKATRTGRFESAPSAMADDGLKTDPVPVAVVVSRPMLAIEHKGPERAFIGRPVVHEFVVTNHGDAAAENTIVECQLPTGATVSNATEGGRTANGTITWNLGTLAPEQARTINVSFASDAAGTARYAATARADCADAVNAAGSTDLAGIPALLLTEYDEPDPVQVGQTVTYNLEITNQGSAPLNNVRLVCSLDEGATMQVDTLKGFTDGSTSGRTITFAPITRLEPKAKAAYKVTVRAIKDGQVQFRAEAASDEITRPLLKVETTNFYR
jgi:uncharacterized repeat protein (TIGR01451 family)